MTVTNLGKNWSNNLCKIVDLAINNALKSSLSWRHGAVLFSKKTVISTACNCLGNRICGYDVPSIHAEAQCLHNIYRRAGRLGEIPLTPNSRKNNSHLLVIRINPQKQLIQSKPCCMCIYLLRLYGVKRVYYTNQQGDLCYQNINHIEQIVYCSHGLILMINKWHDTQINYKLPLTKTQKRLIFIT